MMPIESARDADVELANTVEAYTFLSRHVLENFPRRFVQWRQRKILRHALEHVTGEDMLNVVEQLVRAIR